MNQQILSYLQENKINYSREILTEQLRKAGYLEKDIQEALTIVYD